MHGKILQEKNFVENVKPETWLCLFIIRDITLKQLNSFTSNNTLSCIGGLHVKWCKRSLVQFPAL